MGLFVKKTTVASGVVIWSTVLETATGGFTLDKTNYTDGDIIPAGQPISFDESTRIAKVIKTATLYADATNSATTYQVIKGHSLAVGEFAWAVKGGKSYAITAIDKSNAAYDVLTLGTTLGVALTAGQILVQGNASGTTAAAFFQTPKGLLFEETEVATNEGLSVVLRGTLYARRAVVGNADLQAALPLIIFSQSY